MESTSVADKQSHAAYRAMLGVERVLAQSSIDKPLHELIKIRVSQINRCAYCIDMHWKEARAAGETEQRLYGLSAWQESPYYTERERVGLMFAEELTRVADHSIAEPVREAVRDQFNHQELSDLAWIVSAINAWNRVNIGLRTVPGGYRAAGAAQQ